MRTIREKAVDGLGRLRTGSRLSAAVVVFALVAGACGSATTVDRESLGLMIEADIQAGTRFEVSVPNNSDFSIEVASAPAGVTASISETADGETLLLSVEVGADTPRGAYDPAPR